MNWQEWLKANYDSKKPITMSVPRMSGKAEYLAIVAALANMTPNKGEQK